MPVQSFFLLDETQKAAAEALNYQDAAVFARPIDNPLADQLGLGALNGVKFVIPSVILNNSDYDPWDEFFEEYTIHLLDTEMLFVPFLG